MTERSENLMERLLISWRLAWKTMGLRKSSQLARAHHFSSIIYANDRCKENELRHFDDDESLEKLNLFNFLNKTLESVRDVGFHHSTATLSAGIFEKSDTRCRSIHFFEFVSSGPLVARGRRRHRFLLLVEHDNDVWSVQSSRPASLVR